MSGGASAGGPGVDGGSTVSASTLVDRMAIVDLTVAYTWALDSGDYQALREVFTPAATAELGRIGCDGVDAIIDRVEQALAPLDASQHIVANHQVEITGDTGRCRCYFQAQHVRRGTEGGDNFIIAGSYLDRVVRTSGGWRIVHRVLAMDWTEGNQAVVARPDSWPGSPVP